MPTDSTRISELMQSSDFHKRETEHILISPLDSGVTMFVWFLVGVLVMSVVVLAMV